MSLLKFFLILAGLAAVSSCAPTPISVPITDSPNSNEPLVRNYTDHFVDFWDSSQELTIEARRELFKKQITPLFPEFYDASRFAAAEYGVQSEEFRTAFVNRQIEREIVEFPEIREGYIEKTRAFSNDLAENINRFVAQFPDFSTDNEIVFLHSLGEMDGGKRVFDGKTYLIFGADGMTRFHNFENESAFFQHELFHLHHQQYFSDCEKIWCGIWTEGLATYVAEQLSPQATAAELLLDFPPGMMRSVELRLPESLLHLRDVMELNDPSIYAALLQTSEDETGLQPRRGYYLGYLLAKQLAENYSIDELSKIAPNEAEAIFRTTLNDMISLCSEHYENEHDSCRFARP